MASPPLKLGRDLMGVLPGSDRGGPMSGDRERQMMDDGVIDVSMDELLEFLEGDRVDVRADPEFKERLRRRLWSMVSQRAWRGPQGPTS